MNQPKRTIIRLVALLLVAACLGATGCATADPIVGQWGDGNFAYFEFAQDNTMMIMYVGKSTQGTYAIDGDKITMTTKTEEGQDQSSTYTYKIEGGILTLTNDAGTSETYPKIQ